MTLPGAEAAIVPTTPQTPVLTSLEVIPGGAASVERLAGDRATSNLALGRSPALHGKSKVRIGLVVAGVVAAIVFIAAILLPPVSKGGRESPAKITSINNLKQIGIAIHVHHDAFLMFPSEVPSSVPDRPNPLVPARLKTELARANLSLPRENRLFEEFHQDEPWDSPHNIKLLPQMPKIYFDPRFQEADRRRV